VLPLNADTAKRYGEIKNLLRTKGRPIPENDLWIAAIAQQYDLTLVTRDPHFKSVEKLKIEVW
jgi:tRNA(fMet)-specific endonuclease VapC